MTFLEGQPSALEEYLVREPPVWEFDQDDLYGRGFEMKASAAAR